MSHEFESEFESGFLVRQQAWHGLGTVLENAPTDTREALRLAGLDWTVEQVPVYAHRLSSEGVEQIDCQDHRALVRSTDGRVLGVMGKDYAPLQNREAFRFFEPFLHERDAELDAAGSLKGGRNVWVLAKISDSLGEVAPGDRIVPYLLLSNSHDGSRAVTVAFTAIRVVCWNTLSCAHALADRGRETSIKIRHTSGMERNLRAVRDCIDLARREFVLTLDVLRGMRAREIDAPTMRDYVRRVLGSPQKLIEIAARQSEGCPEIDLPRVRGQDEIERLFARGPGAQLAGSTVYGAYNAITHYIDHVRGTDGDKRLHSTWFGQGAQLRERALDLGRELAGIDA